MTVIVQLLPPASGGTPVIKRMPGSPLASAPPRLSCSVPPQLFVVVRGAATVMAPGTSGNVSVNERPFRASFWFGFVIVKVNLEVPLARIGFGEKSLAMVGGLITLREAVALPVEPVFVPPLVEEINPLTF